MSSKLTIEVNLGPRRDRVYLGYGVHVDHDNEQVWLSTTRDGQQHEIALYPEEVNALVLYTKTRLP